MIPKNQLKSNRDVKKHAIKYAMNKIGFSIDQMYSKSISALLA